MPNADSKIIEDPSRLNILRDLCLLDTPADPAFDRLTNLASRILKVPVSLVSLVDNNRQFFKSQIGLPEPYATERETPLSHSFCQHTVATGLPLIVDNALEHPLVYDNLAIDDLGVVAYLGIPLITSNGSALGSYCVIDHEQRHWTDEEIAILTDLADSVMTEIELRAEIIEREKVEQTLREREYFISEVMHNLPAVIYIYAVETHQLVYINRTVESLLGQPVAEGDLITSLFLENTIEAHDFEHIGTQLRVLETMEADDAVVFEYRFRFQQDAAWSWANSSNQPFLRDEDDKVTHVLGIIRDVTAVKLKAEQDLKIMLEKEQIRMMGEFIRNTSHDLRTPLTIIQTGLDLIPRTSDPDRVKERINHMHESVLQMTKVLDAFVTVGELYDQVKKPNSMVNLNIIVGEAIEILFNRFHVLPTLQAYGDTESALVYGDTNQLCQAIYSLLENAVIHTKDPAIEIGIQIRENRALIEVRDFGDGMEQEALDHIFDLFYKANKARTSNGSGAGLGLAMVKKIVTLHGGTIKATSAEGQGTTMTICLPLLTSPMPA